MSDAFAEAIYGADDEADAEGVDLEAGPNPTDAAVALSDATPDAPAPEGAVEDSNVDWQQRYEEAQKLIGRQGQELGDLRRAQEQYAEPQQQYEPAVASPIDGYTPKQIADHVEAVAAENPMDAWQQAAAFFGHAIENGNLPMARRIAKAVENSIDEDAADRMQDVIDNVRLEQRLAPMQQSYQASAEQHAYNQATDALIAKHPESVQYAEHIALALRSDPDVIDLLEQGKHAAAVRMAYVAARDANPNLSPALHSNKVAEAAYKQSTSVPTGDGRIAPPSQEENPAEAFVVDMLTNAKVRR